MTMVMGTLDGSTPTPQQRIVRQINLLERYYALINQNSPYSLWSGKNEGMLWFLRAVRVNIDLASKAGGIQSWAQVVTIMDWTLTHGLDVGQVSASESDTDQARRDGWMDMHRMLLEWA